MKYQTQVNDTVEVIKAASPSEAARRAVLRYAKGRGYFANEVGPGGASVIVDGVEYVPAAYAVEGQPSWDW